MKTNRRTNSTRKPVNEVFIQGVKELASGKVFFNRAQIVDISPTGLLFHVRREDLASAELRSHLTLDSIHGKSVCFKIEIMDTYIEGIVARTQFKGKEGFVIAVDFREDAPEYWRECLVELLPDKASPKRQAH